MNKLLKRIMEKKNKRKHIITVSVSAFFLGMVILFITIPSRTYVDFIIAVKGKENITWEDFSRFPHTDIGSGRYIFEYYLVGGSHLYLNGSELKSQPESIYIINRDRTITFIYPLRV